VSGFHCTLSRCYCTSHSFHQLSNKLSDTRYLSEYAVPVHSLFCRSLFHSIFIGTRIILTRRRSLPFNVKTPSFCPAEDLLQNPKQNFLPSISTIQQQNLFGFVGGKADGWTVCYLSNMWCEDFFWSSWRSCMSSATTPTIFEWIRGSWTFSSEYSRANSQRYQPSDKYNSSSWLRTNIQVVVSFLLEKLFQITILNQVLLLLVMIWVWVPTSTSPLFVLRTLTITVHMRL